jgi:hypothetical protein
MEATGEQPNTSGAAMPMGNFSQLSSLGFETLRVGPRTS